MSKNDFVFQLIIGIVISVATVFLSIKLWGEELEGKKVKLAFEEKIALKSIDVTDQLIYKASVLYQYLPQYRQREIMHFMYGGIIPKAIIDKRKEIVKPIITKEEMVEKYVDFQIKLISSKPYIDREVFILLTEYSESINPPIFIDMSPKEILELYLKSSISLNLAMDRIRYIYGYGKISENINSEWSSE